jgi:hypothetical protein
MFRKAFPSKTKIAVIAAFVVFGTAPLLSGYYYAVLGAGCYQFDFGYSAYASCQVTGECKSGAASQASAYAYLNCNVLTGYVDAQSYGRSSQISEQAHAQRSDNVFSFDVDNFCSCDYGCSG